MIRLLKDKKIYNIPLESLSKEDQTYIEELVYAIQEAEEKKAAAAEAKAKTEAPKKESQ